MRAGACTLRRASTSDLEAILALQEACVEAPRWSRASWLSTLAPDRDTTPARVTFVAEISQGLVGFAVGSAVGSVAELETVAVHEQARRQGIGKLLCQQIITWSRRSGAQTIELEVRASSEGALTLYRLLRFVEQGRRPGYYCDPAEDAVLMAAHL